MPKLTGKAAIVTGSSRGIGRAIAIRLAHEGARVVLTGRDTTLLDSAVGDIEKAGGAAASIVLDLRVPDAPQRLADFAVDKYKRIDIVVNNAGATKRGEFTLLTDEDWADGFALKFFGTIRLTRAAWPQLKANSGSVVIISGAGGRTPGAEFTIGGSVNAALLSFTKAMADVGIRDGVQVNAINPGAVRTDRFQKRLESFAKERGVDLASAERHIVSESRTTRIGETDDIAGLVSFITGPQGRFLQGALIDMDGGSTKTI
jgi:NAD(P)-dependent dehydrogenase (short-subunit alcohol dehydrogenase family)